MSKSEMIEDIIRMLKEIEKDAGITDRPAADSCATAKSEQSSKLP